MFTGIITDVGHVLALEQRGDLKARIGTSYDVAGIDIGASIACEGVCLTVIALGTEPQNWFDVEISAESVGLTNIRAWAEGKRLNLERALKVGDELGGHIVSGHVDGVAEVVEMKDEGDSTRVTFRAPKDLALRPEPFPIGAERDIRVQYCARGFHEPYFRTTRPR